MQFIAILFKLSINPFTLYINCTKLPISSVNMHTVVIYRSNNDAFANICGLTASISQQWRVSNYNEYALHHIQILALISSSQTSTT